MNFVIHSMGMPFNGDTLKHSSLGGSETAAYYMARELAHRGHRVVMFTGSPDEGVFDGVIYCHYGTPSQETPLGDKFTQFACNTPHDVLIIQRHQQGFHKDYASKVNILQMHDLALSRFAGSVHAGGLRLDIVTGVSQFHIDQIRSVYSVRDEILRVVPNGVDPELYMVPLNYDELNPAAELVSQSEGMRYLYQSRPERGLEHLVRPGGIMARLAKQGSTARLFVCAYKNTTDAMAGYYQQLDAWARALPNVTMLGALTKQQLSEVQRLCDALVYPTEFEEVSCITAMEAMHAGLPFISSDCGALRETCAESGSILIPLKDGSADEDAFVDTLIKWEKDTGQHGAYRSAQEEAAQSKTWADAVDKLELEIDRVLMTRNTPARLARHLIDHSDIYALDVAVGNKTLNGESKDALLRASLRERTAMYGFVESAEALRKHYEFWEEDSRKSRAAKGIDHKHETAAVQQSTRFIGINHLLSQWASGKEGRKLRVLEFGCAHGHITTALAKLHPHIEFVGMDFVEKSIEEARSRVDRLPNLEFRVGTIIDVESECEEFDAIIAAEVIEHIYDYQHALLVLLDALVDDGALILTTPNGKWEWQGRENWQKGREHLHHFERDDLVELFAEFPHTILHAPGGADLGGIAMGSWVTRVIKHEGAELGEINYLRKLATQAPRDTISLCMIVHNAEDTITRALKSVAAYVDEIVIAIDPNTTDRTYERIGDIRNDYPHVNWVVYRAPASPLDVGFDEARNRTVDASSGDWILWMDADEEFVNARNILRCLRPGAFNAFAIAQHHMSQQPPSCITTDYPCRLFRRDSGARFYGVVHEHPEVKVGSAIPHSFHLPDVSLMHYGYTDETARRGRYKRNFPLLLKDLEKHPDRHLNKFLYIRDLAQGVAFEGESTESVSEQMVAASQRVVELFEEMVDTSPMLRMVVDALPYYSTASATLGGGFSVTMSIRTDNAVPGMDRPSKVEGHFHSTSLYEKLLSRVVRESVSGYNDKYL